MLDQRAIGVLAIGLFVSVIAADAQTPVALVGIVSDSQERPIQAEVHLLQAADGLLGRTVSTDSNGFFRISELADAPIEVRVDAPGFTPVSRELDVTRGETLSLMFQLHRLTVVRGRVLDTNGHAVTNANVKATTVSVDDEGRRLITRVAEPSWSTDREGDFVIRAPAGQPFYVEIMREDCVFWRSDQMVLAESEESNLHEVTLDCGL